MRCKTYRISISWSIEPVQVSNLPFHIASLFLKYSNELNNPEISGATFHQGYGIWNGIIEKEITITCQTSNVTDLMNIMQKIALEMNCEWAHTTVDGYDVQFWNIKDGKIGDGNLFKKH